MSEDSYDPEKLVGTTEAAGAARRSPATIRTWARRGRLPVVRWEKSPTGQGKLRPLYRLGDVMDAERLARERDDTSRALAAAQRHLPAHNA